jgi:hypothetical protein
MILPESQWRLGAVQGYGYELVEVAAATGFIEHPV